MNDIHNGPSLLDDDDDDDDPTEKVFKINVVIFGVGIIVGLIAAVMVFFTAPVVGGEWWPYIRFVVTIIVGVIAFYITAAVMTIIVVRSFVREWF